MFSKNVTPRNNASNHNHPQTTRSYNHNNNNLYTSMQTPMPSLITKEKIYDETNPSKITDQHIIITRKIMYN